MVFERNEAKFWEGRDFRGKRTTKQCFPTYAIWVLNMQHLLDALVFHAVRRHPATVAGLSSRDHR